MALSSNKIYATLVSKEFSKALETKVSLIGRAGNCHMIINHPSISKEHAIIEFDEKGIASLKDLSSLNGTYINDKRITSGGQCILKNRDIISFGKDLARYCLVYENDAISQSNPTTPIVSGGINLTANNRPKIGGGIRDKKISMVDDTDELLLLTRKNNIKSPTELPNQYQQPIITSTKEPNKLYDDRVSFTNDLMNYSSNPNVKNTIENYKPISQNDNFPNSNMNNAITRNEMLELSAKLLEKEELLLKKEGEIRICQSEIESLREECEKSKSKLKALELYSSDLQRRFDLVNQELKEKENLLYEIQNTDASQKALIIQTELKSLRQILSQKDDEINICKKQLQAVLQTQNDPNINVNHYQNFLEQQAKELTLAKKQVLEYEGRNEECKRKWNQLIKENIAKEEKIKGLMLQVNRQIESYQKLYNDQDAKINKLNEKFINLVSMDQDSKEKEAALFLVQQIQVVLEEKYQMSMENEQLHLQIQELIEEVKRLNGELESYSEFVEDNGSMLKEPRTNTLSVAKLKAKLDEMQDLIYEIKQKEGVAKVVELLDTIAHLETSLINLTNQNEDFKNKLNKTSASPINLNEQNCIEFFSKLLDDKDKKIVYLTKQNEILETKDKQNQVEIGKLKEDNKNLLSQFDGYKARQQKLEEILANQNGQTLSSNLLLDPLRDKVIGKNFMQVSGDRNRTYDLITPKLTYMPFDA